MSADWKTWSDMAEEGEVTQSQVALTDDNAGLFGPAGACEPFRATTPPLYDPRPAPDPYLLYGAAPTDDSMYTTARPDARPSYGERLAQVPYHDAPRRRGGYDQRRGGYGHDQRRDSRHTEYHEHRGYDRPEPPHWEPRTVDWGQPPEPAAPKHTVGAIFIRTRKWGAHCWYEFMMENMRGEWVFPTVETSLVGGAVDTGPAINQLMTAAAKRGMLFLPSNPTDVDRCFQQSVTPDGRTTYRAYLVPFEATQRPKKDRALGASPVMYWVSEAEASTHAQMGAPSALGKALSARALAALAGLPLHLKFASSTPPLVVYHGTDAGSVSMILASGLLPSSKPGMLGPGVYFAKWDKAMTFALEDADRNRRPEAGVIIRCYVFAGSCTTMTQDMVCTCGCGKPFVDHNGRHGAGRAMTFVADNSLPATRRAEWCVRDLDAILQDGVFNMGTGGGGYRRA